MSVYLELLPVALSATGMLIGFVTLLFKKINSQTRNSSFEMPPCEISEGSRYIEESDIALDIHEDNSSKAKGTIKQSFDDTITLDATFFSTMVEFYKDRGDYNSAIVCALKAKDIKEKILGTMHPDTATSYNNLATLYQATGSYDDAFEYALKAKDIMEKILDIMYVDTATSYSNLASLYQATGDYDDALSYALKAKDIIEKVSGPDHPNTQAIRRTLESLTIKYRIPDE